MNPHLRRSSTQQNNSITQLQHGIFLPVIPITIPSGLYPNLPPRTHTYIQQTTQLRLRTTCASAVFLILAFYSPIFLHLLPIPIQIQNDSPTPSFFCFADATHLPRRALLPLHIALPPRHTNPTGRAFTNPVQAFVSRD